MLPLNFGIKKSYCGRGELKGIVKQRKGRDREEERNTSQYDIINTGAELGGVSARHGVENRGHPILEPLMHRHAARELYQSPAILESVISFSTSCLCSPTLFSCSGLKTAGRPQHTPSLADGGLTLITGSGQKLEATVTKSSPKGQDPRKQCRVEGSRKRRNWRKREQQRKTHGFARYM